MPERSWLGVVPSARAQDDDVHQADVAFAPLHAAHVGPVQPAVISKPFLREAQAEPGFSHLGRSASSVADHY